MRAATLACVGGKKNNPELFIFNLQLRKNLSKEGGDIRESSCSGSIRARLNLIIYSRFTVCEGPSYSLKLFHNFLRFSPKATRRWINEVKLVASNHFLNTPDFPSVPFLEKVNTRARVPTVP